MLNFRFLEKCTLSMSFLELEIIAHVQKIVHKIRCKMS